MKYFRFILIFILAAAAAGCSRKEKADYGAVFTFASLDESQKMLGTPDDFTNAMSNFDRSARMGTNRLVTQEEFLEFVSNSAVEWSPLEKQFLTDTLNTIQNKLKGLNLDFPEIIYMVKTTGEEEGGTPYTRQNMVILPETFMDSPQRNLEDVIVHELFHIYTRNNPNMIDPLYEIIGFYPCPEIEFPMDIRERRITNPDAPHNNHYITVTYQDSAVNVVPIVFGTIDRDQIVEGVPFFQYIEFGLLGVENVAGAWVPQLKNDSALIIPFPSVTGYMEKVGFNTQYIVHPEEILADNFVLLVNQAKDVASPDVVDFLEKVLKGERE